MLIGNTIFYEDASPTTIYGPWIPRQSDAVWFSAKVIAKRDTGTPTLKVTVQTKNNGDTTTVNPGSGAASMLVSTTNKLRCYGLRELVRLEYVMNGGNTGDWIHFEVANPSWEPN